MSANSDIVEQLETLARGMSSDAPGIVGVVENSDAKLIAEAAAEIRRLKEKLLGGPTHYDFGWNAAIEAAAKLFYVPDDGTSPLGDLVRSKILALKRPEGGDGG